MTDLFLIKGETLKSTADKLRGYLSSVSYSFNPDILGEDGLIVENSVTSYYHEFMDSMESYTGIAENTKVNDIFIAYDYLENNKGQIVPVLYKTNIESYPDEADYEDAFFYEGTAEIDGESFDKWRKIEESGSDNFTWNSEAKQYMYTNPVVIAEISADEINPTDFPSKIDDVYETGYAKGQATGESESMLGVWELKDEITPPPNPIEMSFICDGTKYVRIADEGDGVYYYDENGDAWSVYYYNGEWDDSTWKIIEILEKPPKEAADWVKANGKKKDYGDGYNDGYNDGYGESYNTGYNIGYNIGYSNGNEAGVTAFWGEKNYRYLFAGVSNISYVNKYVDWLNKAKINSTSSMFYECAALTTVPLFDTSKVTNMGSMFNGCIKLTTVPLFDTSKVTNMGSMFNGCIKLTTVPLFDTKNVTAMTTMFGNCTALTTVPLFDTSKVTNMGSMFGNCTALTTVPELDIRNVTGTSNMFYNCTNITDIRLRNITISLTVSDCLLTVDSLVHLIYELRRTNSTTKTLSMGSANLKKLADVYVKPITVTDEMRAEDDLIDQKRPFVVCESTDEGAMLITDYALSKLWKLS